MPDALFFILKKKFKNLFSQLTHKKEEIPRLEVFQDKIKYHFKNPSLLNAALSHTSLPSSHSKSSIFERMEFLGDSILGLVVSEELFLKYPNYNEGELSKLKSKIVSKKMLTLKAKEIDLNNFIQLSTESVHNGGLDSILADAMESVICAIYLDGNLENVRSFLKKFVLKDANKLIKREELIDYKSKLQEFTQSKYQKIPEYKIIREEGPEHEKVFTVEVNINQEIFGYGKGSNKKEAQQNAAKEICHKLKL